MKITITVVVMLSLVGCGDYVVANGANECEVSCAKRVTSEYPLDCNAVQSNVDAAIDATMLYAKTLEGRSREEVCKMMSQYNIAILDVAGWNEKVNEDGNHTHRDGYFNPYKGIKLGSQMLSLSHEFGHALNWENSNAVGAAWNSLFNGHGGWEEKGYKAGEDWYEGQVVTATADGSQPPGVPENWVRDLSCENDAQE